MGPKGRKVLVDNWSQYLPMYSTQEPIAHAQPNPNSPMPGSPIVMHSGVNAGLETEPEEEDEEEEMAEGN